VRDGQETAFELELVAGFPARIEVGAGTGVGGGEPEVARTWVGLQDGAGAQELWLAPGVYRVVFRAQDGFEAEGKLEVLAGAQEPALADLRF
jgi:hypothetical protein